MAWNGEFQNHPLIESRGGLIHRMHPTKGWQWWSPMSGAWARDDGETDFTGGGIGILPPGPHGNDLVVTYEETINDPEEGP